MEWWNAKKSGDEWHKLILIGIYTGLRLGDCCRLDWSQINLAQEVIQLVPRKTCRHHQRLVTIPIHPALGAALVEREVKVKGEGEQWNLSSSPAGQAEEANHHCSTSNFAFRHENIAALKSAVAAIPTL